MRMEEKRGFVHQIRHRQRVARPGRPGCRVCLVLSYTPTAGATHAKTRCRIHPLSLTLSLLSSGVYGSQMGRDDFEPEDIDYYFEYTGSLAVRED